MELVIFGKDLSTEFKKVSRSMTQEDRYILYKEMTRIFNYKNNMDYT